MKQSDSLQQKSWISSIMIGCVLLEMIYRIFLQNQFGAAGLALFEPVYGLYMFLWVMSAIGIPMAISHIISSRLKKGDRSSTQSILMICLATSAGFGLFVCILLWAFSGSIAQGIGLANSINLIRWMAPCVFLTTILGAFRGYFSGMRMRIICDISIIIEQVFKVLVGIIFVLIWSNAEIVTKITGAMVGIIVAYVASLIFLGIIYMTGIDQVNQRSPSEKQMRIKVGPMISRLLGQELSISIGAGFFPLMLLIDACIGIGLLAPKGGQTLLTPTVSYGVLAGVAWPMILFPILIAMVLCKKSLTTLTYATTKQHSAMIQKQLNLMIKVAFVIGMLWTGLLWSLADPIAGVFFVNGTEQEIWMLASLVRLIAVAALFGTVGQIASRSMQKLGFDMMSLIAVLFAVVIKIILMNVVSPMIREPIFGIAFSSVIAMGIVAVISLVYVSQFARTFLLLGFYGFRSLMVAALTGIVVYFLSIYILFVYLPPVIAMVIAVFVFAVLGLGLCVGLGVISSEDIKMIKNPKKMNKEVSEE